MWKKAYSGSFRSIVLVLLLIALIAAVFYFFIPQLPIEEASRTTFIVIAIFFIFFLLAFIYYMRTDKKETESSKPLSYYNEKYAKYVKVVQSVAQKYSEKMPTDGWTKTLDECVYVVATECDFRHLTDFDMAACLIFALTKHGKSKRPMLFAYCCVRNLMPIPRKYLIKIERDNEIFLKLPSLIQYGRFPEPTREFLMLLRSYVYQMSDAYDVIALSDFLRMLFITDFPVKRN